MDDDEYIWNNSLIYPTVNVTSTDHTILAGMTDWGDDFNSASNSAIQTESLEVNGVDVGEFMESINQRLLILQDDFEKHKKYPALKEAYEQYKLIEKLLKEE